METLDSPVPEMMVAYGVTSTKTCWTSAMATYGSVVLSSMQLPTSVDATRTISAFLSVDFVS